MVDTKELEELRLALSEAIKISRRLDKCHQTYLERTRRGFSRPVTTSYSANSSNLSTALRIKLDTVEALAQKSLRI